MVSRLSADLDDLQLEESVSALLAEYPPSPTASDKVLLGHRQAQPSQLRFIILALHLSTYCFTSRLVRYSAVLNRSTVLSLPILQAAAWAAGLALWARCAPRGKLGGKVGLAFRGEEGRSAVVLGALTTLSTLTHLWEARTLQGRLWQAIQVSPTPPRSSPTLPTFARRVDQPGARSVWSKLTSPYSQTFILPSLLLLPIALPTRWQAQLSLPDRLPPFLFLTAVAGSFLVGFALLGVPAVELGLVVSILRLPLEAVRLSLLKTVLGLDRVGGILAAGAVVSGCSCVGCVRSGLGVHRNSRLLC